MTRRHLRYAAIAQILVPLVLNRNSDEAAIWGNSRAVGLPAQITRGKHFAASRINRMQNAGRVGEAFRCVFRNKHRVFKRGYGCWLAIWQREYACGNRIRRIGDVDKTDHACRAVGIDQCHAIARGRDNLG